MLNPFKSKSIQILAITLILISGCQPVNQQPTTPVKPSPSTKPKTQGSGTPVDLLQSRQIVSGQIFDSKTHQLIQNETKIRISGPDSNQLEQTSILSKNGKVGLTLKSGIKPTSTSPLHLTVVAESSGYFTASSQVDISDHLETFSLNLTSKTQPPAGVGTVSDDSNSIDRNNGLNKAFLLQTQVNGNNAKFQLNNGTMLRDSQGQPLNGPLKAEVGYFSNTTADSLNAFPGGFSPNTVMNNGQNQQGYFQTGGFVSVDISDSSGRKATQFSQPANITVQIPAGTMNPDTHQPVQSGDSIGIWSHDTTTGAWSLEGQAKVSQGNNGNFDVTYPVSHLSYWNLDWFLSDRCNPQLNLNWDTENHIPVNVKMLMDDQNWYTHSNLLQDPNNQLFNVPVNREITFVASFGSQEVGRTKIRLNQSCQPIQLNINTQQLPKLHKIPLTVTLGSQTQFTRSDIEQLAARFGINQEVTQKVLAYTHPGDPNQQFGFSDKAYQDLINLGVTSTQIQAVKYLLEQTYRPSTYLGYYLDQDPTTYSSTFVNEGSGEVSLFEGQDYRFYGYVYYNNHSFYIEKLVKINPGETELRLDMKDVELTLEIVKGFLAQIGIQLPF